MTKSKRTAIVFIHGQGEHEPMAAARRLAETAMYASDSDTEVNTEFVADSDLNVYEASHIKAEKTDSDQRTDFIEYYWSHLVSGSTLNDVWLWFRGLIRQPFHTTPEQFKPIRETVIFLAAIAVVFVAAFSMLTASVFVGRDIQPNPAKHEGNEAILSYLERLGTRFDVSHNPYSIQRFTPFQSDDNSADGLNPTRLVASADILGVSYIAATSDNKLELSVRANGKTELLDHDPLLIDGDPITLEFRAWDGTGRPPSLAVGTDQGRVHIVTLDVNSLTTSKPIIELTSFSIRSDSTSNSVCPTGLGLGSNSEYVSHIVWMSPDQIAAWGDEGFFGVFERRDGDGLSIDEGGWNLACDGVAGDVLNTETRFELLEFHAESNTLAVIDEESDLIVGTLSDSKFVQHFELELKALLTDSSATSMAMSRRGETLAIGADDGRIFLFDSGTGDLRQGWPAKQHYGAVGALAFAANGDLLSGGNDSRVLRWMLNSSFEPGSPGQIIDSAKYASWFSKIIPLTDGGYITLDDEQGWRQWDKDVGPKSTRVKNLVTPAFPDGSATNAFPISRAFPVLLLEQIHGHSGHGQSQESKLFVSFALDDSRNILAESNEYGTGRTSMDVAQDLLIYATNYKNSDRKKQRKASEETPHMATDGANHPTSAADKKSETAEKTQAGFRTVKLASNSGDIVNFSSTAISRFHDGDVVQNIILGAVERESSGDREELISKRDDLVAGINHTLHLVLLQAQPKDKSDLGRSQAAFDRDELQPARHFRCRFQLDHELTGFSVASNKQSEMTDGISENEGDTVQIVLSDQTHLKYLQIRTAAFFKPQASEDPPCVFLDFASRTSPASLTIADNGESLVVLDTQWRVSVYELGSFLLIYEDLIAWLLALDNVELRAHSLDMHASDNDQEWFESEEYKAWDEKDSGVRAFFGSYMYNIVGEKIDSLFTTVAENYSGASNKDDVFGAYNIRGPIQSGVDIRDYTRRHGRDIAEQSLAGLRGIKLVGESGWYQYKVRDQDGAMKVTARWLDWILNRQKIPMVKDPQAGQLFACGVSSSSSLSSRCVPPFKPWSAPEEAPVWKNSPDEMIVQFVSDSMLMITLPGGIVLQDLPLSQDKRMFGEARWIANELPAVRATKEPGEEPAQQSTGGSFSSDGQQLSGLGEKSRQRFMRSAILVEEDAELTTSEWGTTPAQASSQTTLIGFDSGRSNVALELARADILDASPYPSIRRGSHLLMTLMAPILVIATLFSIISHSFMRRLFSPFEKRQNSVSGIAGSLRAAEQDQDDRPEFVRLALVSLLFFGLLVICCLAFFWISAGAFSGDSLSVKARSFQIFGWDHNFHVYHDPYNVALLCLSLLAAILIFAIPIFLTRILSLVYRLRNIVVSQLSTVQWVFVATILCVLFALGVLSGSAALAQSNALDLEMNFANLLTWIAVLGVCWFIIFPNVLKGFLTVALVIGLPVLFMTYILNTTGHSDFGLNTVQTEVLFGLGVLALFAIWFRALMLGLLFAAIALPLTLWGFAELLQDGVQFAPDGTFLLELDKLYVVIIGFIFIGIIANIGLMFAPAKLSWVRLLVYAFSVVLIFVGAFNLDFLLRERELDWNVYFIWAATLILLIALLAGLGWTVTRSFLVPIMADTARYLSAQPRDVALSRQVREDGVRMLEALHASNRYDRIVIVAHSLGSIVGLDIVSRFWARRSERMIGMQETAYEAALENSKRTHKEILSHISQATSYLADALSSGRSKDTVPANGADHSVLKRCEQILQRLDDRARESDENGVPFRSARAFQSGGLDSVDLIAKHIESYATRLRNGNQKRQKENADLLDRAVASFNAAKVAVHQDRERIARLVQVLKHASPTGDKSPVWLISDFVTIGSPLTHGEWLLTEQRHADYPKTFSKNVPIDEPGQQPNRFGKDILPVKWTNLFFETRWVVVGDIIGGPLWKKFGVGVKDVMLIGRRPNFRFFAHNEYWKLDKKWLNWRAENNQETDVPEHVQKLQKALF